MLARGVLPPRCDGRRVRAELTRDAHAFKLSSFRFCFGGDGRAALAGGWLCARVALVGVDTRGEARGPRACSAVPAMELEEAKPALFLLGALAFGVAAAGASDPNRAAHTDMRGMRRPQRSGALVSGVVRRSLQDDDGLNGAHPLVELFRPRLRETL